MIRSIRMFCRALLLLLFISTLYSHAAIITVKKDGTGDYQNIQQAVDSAYHGDTILVHPGRYIENINVQVPDTIFNLFIASLNWTTGDPAYISQTIIDGGESGTCFETHHSKITLWGFTVENGKGIEKPDHSSPGSGIRASDCQLVVKNCIIQNNEARITGGGIIFDDGTLLISGTTVRHNCANYAGGIYCANSFFLMDTVEKCNIYHNHAYQSGMGDLILYDIINGIRISIDTFTVKEPDKYFLKIVGNQKVSHIDIRHGKIEQVTNDLYVSPEGSNDNTGLTPGEPLKNIWYAIAKIKPGSTPTIIYLSEGNYSPSMNGEKFPLGLRNNINISGSGKYHSIIDGDSLSFIFYGGYLDSVRINDLTVRNGRGATENGYLTDYAGLMKFTYCKKVEIYDVLFTRGYSRLGSAFMAGGIDHLLISGTDFIDNYSQHALRMGVKEHSTVKIINCRFINNSYLFGFSSFGGALMAGSSPFESNDMRFDLINCEFTETNSWDFTTVVLILGKVPANIINCTFGNNSWRCTPLVIHEEATARVYNSSFHNGGTNEISVGSSSQKVKHELEVYNSLITGGESKIYVSSVSSIYYDDPSCIDDYPSWQETGPYPYYLMPNSACIDAGTLDLPEGIEIPQYDPAGDLRIAGNGIDIGAYEYIGLVGTENYDTEDQDHIILFPNPADDILHISSSSLEVKEITIYLPVGFPVGRFTMKSSPYSLNISDLPKGLYIMEIKSPGGAVTLKKLVIQ